MTPPLRRRGPQDCTRSRARTASHREGPTFTRRSRAARPAPPACAAARPGGARAPARQSAVGAVGGGQMAALAGQVDRHPGIAGSSQNRTRRRKSSSSRKPSETQEWLPATAPTAGPWRRRRTPLADPGTWSAARRPAASPDRRHRRRGPTPSSKRERRPPPAVVLAQADAVGHRHAGHVEHLGQAHRVGLRPDGSGAERRSRAGRSAAAPAR